jgi:hypothetical protein
VLKQWPAIGGGCGKAVLVLLSLFPVSCGTGIQFEARTVVASGGAVTRTTRFIASTKRAETRLRVDTHSLQVECGQPKCERGKKMRRLASSQQTFTERKDDVLSVVRPCMTT